MFLKTITRTILMNKQSFRVHFLFNNATFKSQHQNFDTFLISQRDFANYYEPRLLQLDFQSRRIISQMADPSCDRKLLALMLDKYLDFSRQDHKRTPQGLVTLLTALQKANYRNFRDEYTNVICEYIIRSPDMSIYKFNQRSFTRIISSLVAKNKHSTQKAKKHLLKYKIVELLKMNTNNMQGNNLVKIIGSILELRDPSSLSERIRFATLVEILQIKITNMLKKDLKVPLSEQQFKKMSYPLKLILQFYECFSPKHEESIKTLWEALDKYIFQNQQKYHTFFLYGFFIYFPNSCFKLEGQYYRDLILQKLKVTKPSNDVANVYEPWHDVKFGYSILSFAFYKHMNQLQFRYKDDFNYILQEDISVPEIDPYFWQMYNKQPHEFKLKDIIMHNIIKKIYPQKFIETPECNIPFIRPPVSTQNEVKLRMKMALQHLGMEHQVQGQVQGRFVDFILQGGIILECDGDYHFSMHGMEYDEPTHFRNLHLVLAGYKVILINIFQYNQNRYADQLSALIAKKLKFMQENQAVLVI